MNHLKINNAKKNKKKLEFTI